MIVKQNSSNGYELSVESNAGKIRIGLFKSIGRTNYKQS